MASGGIAEQSAKGRLGSKAEIQSEPLPVSPFLDVDAASAPLRVPARNFR